jgi:hypothetical protein
VKSSSPGRDLAGHGPIPATLASKIAHQAETRSDILLPQGPYPSQAPIPDHGDHPDPPNNRDDDNRGDGSPGHGSPGDSSPGDGSRDSGSACSGDASSGRGRSGHSVYSLTDHGPGDQKNCPNEDRRYKPPQSLIDKIITLHQRCRHPGCQRLAQNCDVDHVIPYADGGGTCACNLVPLCRFHHRLKTFGGWMARLTTPDEPYPSGTVEWTSRHGQRILDLPPEHPGSNAWTPPPPHRPRPGQDQTDPPVTRTETETDARSGTDTGTGSDADAYLDPAPDESLAPRRATSEERRTIRTWLWTHQLKRINKGNTSAPPQPTDPLKAPQPPPLPPDYGEPPF